MTHVPAPPPPDRLFGWFTVEGVMNEGSFDGDSGQPVTRWFLRLRHEPTNIEIHADAYSVRSGFRPGQKVHGSAVATNTAAHRFRHAPQGSRPGWAS